MLERHTNMLRGKLAGSSGFSQAICSAPDFRPSTACATGSLPAASASATRSSGLVRSCGADGSQPMLGAGVQVDHAEFAVLAAVGGGAQHFLHVQLLVTPLAGVGVEERGAVHLARRARPVRGEGQRRPAELRPQLFLAHVVRPAAAALAHAAAHHQHVDDAAVDHVHVVPVVQAGADDHHGLALCRARSARTRAPPGSPGRAAPRCAFPARPGCRARRRHRTWRHCRRPGRDPGRSWPSAGRTRWRPARPCRRPGGCGAPARCASAARRARRRSTGSPRPRPRRPDRSGTGAA